MKVIHVISGLADGGAERVLSQLVLREVNTDQRVISLTDSGKYGALLRDHGIEVICLHMPRGWVTIKGLVRLFRNLRQDRSAIVQTWMYHADLLGGIVGRLAQVRGISWGIRLTDLRPVDISLSTRLVARVCALLSRWVPDVIVCCAEAALVSHAKVGYDKSKIVVVPNGYDMRTFQDSSPNHTDSLRAELGISDETFLIGMVARYHPVKDHQNLIAALGEVKLQQQEFVCALVGTDIVSDNIELTQSISQAGLDENVFLLGPRNDIPEVMRSLDLHVLSSRSEGFPNALAEAMASGTPCVTTDVGDAAIIVGPYGTVVPPRNSTELGRAITDALFEKKDYPAKWAARCHGGAERISDLFSLEQMLARYKQVWRSVGTDQVGVD